MDILIAGAGIGGLTAALSLHAAGFGAIRIIESAKELRPLGVGLNILPNAVRELSELGLLDALSARAILTRELAFYNRHGNLIWSEPRGRHAGHRWPQLSIHRGHLQGVLAAAVEARLGERAILTGARVNGFTEAPGGRLRVTLEHRTTGATEVVETDLLIGADGVRSSVRAALYPGEGEPPSNGLVMWRGTTWARPFLTGQSMIVAGDESRRVVLYPIVPGSMPEDPVLINWIAARPMAGDAQRRGDWSRSVAHAKVLEHFGSFGFDWLDIPAVIRAAREVYEYPMVDRDPLPRWTFGRVTLLGDAAHAMYPMGSNGATQAIIDARALAYHLRTSTDVDEALAAYERDRRPVTTSVQINNRQEGPEVVIKLANQRAPQGFTRIEDVIPRRELMEISERYARAAGFDPETLNSRASYSVSRGPANSHFS